MGYFPPIFAIGRSSVKQVSTTPSVGDFTVDIDNSGGEYVTGSVCFIDDGSGGDPQFLGECISVTATSITVNSRYAIENSLGASARVWQPTSSVRFTTGHGPAILQSSELGTVVESTRGAVHYATTVRDNVRWIVLHWTEKHPVVLSEYNDLLSFLETDTNQSRDSFSLGFWEPWTDSSKVHEVRMGQRAVDRRFNSAKGFSSDDVPQGFQSLVELILVNSSTYVP